MTRFWNVGAELISKAKPDEMIAHRCIQVPICFNIQYPGLIQIHDFEVLMVNDDPSPGDRLSPETLTTADQDPPGLAILDPGCTRTMYGTLRLNSANPSGESVARLPLTPSRSFQFNQVNGELHSAEALAP